MQTEAVGSSELAVVAGDVLALRGAGLAAPETWALLCQAAQALQDLFLSNGGVVGGSGVGPTVTPHTLELTPRGRVTLQLASPEAARAYLPPEYRPGRVYSDTDSEKMWMYSLGRALLDTTPRVAALTGSVSVSPSSALQSVLAAMTEPDPRRRASLMNLLDVISEYCRTRLQSKPFTHIVMDMYREVIRSPQYSARKRAAFPAFRPVPVSTQRPHQRQNQHRAQSQQHNQLSQHPKQHQTQQHQQQPHTGHFSKHQVKGALFKAQSRNSRSHPNLLSLSGHEPSLSNLKPQFQSQMDIQMGTTQQQQNQQPVIHHARTSSQPEYSERVQRGLTGQTRSTHNLIMSSNGQRAPQTTQTNVYSDPIYALPVKPFLSSQDVRVNGLLAKSSMEKQDFYGQTITGRPRSVKNCGLSQPNISHLARGAKSCRPLEQTDNVRGKGSVGRNSQTAIAHSLHRQYSNPQLPTRNFQEPVTELRHYSQSNGSAVPPRLRVFTGDNEVESGQENNTEMKLVSSMKVPGLHDPVPPKPPRVITTLKRSAAVLPESNNGLSESIAPAKPPRLAIKNGPRARRGKPVQRAPSRLYRAIGGSTRSFNKTQCVGPEFVVRANQPPKILCVGDTKASSTGRIVVILLTGQRIEVTCDPQKITAGELFQAIVQAEGLDENFTLGLAALLAGDFAMLPPETKLNKVAPPGWLNGGKNKGSLGLPTSFMLYLRFRFFLPSLRGTRSWISKHLLYLQIRRCILEQQLVCPLAQLVSLTGLALQAEFGNYSVNEHGRGDYFLLEHYIPESLILNPDLQMQQTQLSGGAEVLRTQLHQAHRDRRGLDANNAEEMFITHSQALPDYGSHYYIATVDNKELEKIISRLKKSTANRSPSATNDNGLYACTENIYQLESEGPIYGKIEFNHIDSSNNVQSTAYTDEQKNAAVPKGSKINEGIYSVPLSPSAINLVEANNNSNNGNINNKLNKSKKSESNVWLAIHAQGLKLFERGGRPRDRTELAKLQWRDIQTLSYSKNSLVVYTRINGKRCKFKLRMDHKKSYYAFKLTSLHHQFFLKLRSELTSLHGLAKDFGIPIVIEPVSAPVKLKSESSKPKITIVSSPKNITNPKYPMQLEEYQNKENENPQKILNPVQKSEDIDTEPVCYTPEEDALYAQVNARLEPEGASRDTEDEFDRPLVSRDGNTVEILQQQRTTDENKLYSYPSLGLPCEKESLYSIPKQMSSNDIDRLNSEIKRPEELYAAINKNKKNREYPVPDEVWDVENTKKSLHKVKTSSLPNYGTPRQSTGFRTPSLPRRLGVKMGTRAIHSSVVQRDSNLTDDLESLSVKSDTASSIQSASAQSNESPMPEAYVLNADIRTDDETFRIGNDDTMSASLAARLEELSFAEERILHTIQLERGHGGSIGLQVTEGNDGGVYVQAVSVGGSADMAGNVNKGDRIVAINGQSLLNLRYEDALKMLQSSSETVELVLSQITSNRHGNLRREQLQEPVESNYLQNLRFDVTSEAETSSMTTKWLSQRANDVASVQNTSSAYSSAASSSMGNHNTNNIYLTDPTDTNAFNSAMEISAPPPVPPRRRKRKTDLLITTKPITATRTILKEHTTSLPPAGSRPGRKPRSLPPPPPVPNSVVPRERKPQSTENSYLPSAILHNSRSKSVKNDSGEMRSGSKPLAEVFDDSRKNPRFVVTEVISVEENAIPAKNDIDNAFCGRRSDVNLTYRNENRSGRSSPMPEGYSSSLFFTLRDFESVMADSGQSDRSANEQFDSIVTLEPSEPASIPSFIENLTVNDVEDDDEQVYFRVTTTNLPFEKCLDSWGVSYDGGSFNGKFDEIDDHYIFEDYMDRSKRLNSRAAAAAFLFDDETFQNFDRDEPANLRSATKVRFVIESPSTSTIDNDLDNTFESLHNVDSLIDHDGNINGNHETSVIITEITETCQSTEVNDNTGNLTSSDEFGDVPFSSLIENEITMNDLDFRETHQSDSDLPLKQADAANKKELKTLEDIDSVESKNYENRFRPRSTPSPRFTSPKKIGFDPIPNIDEILMAELPTTYDPREEGFIRKKWNTNTELDFIPESFGNDRSNHSKTSRKTSNISESSRMAREAFVSGKLSSESNENRWKNSSIHDDVKNDEANKTTVVKQKIFIDSALRDIIGNFEDDIDWSDTSDEDENKEMLDDVGNAGSSNLNDRRVEESDDTKMVNRDTCSVQEVPLDKYPRSSGSMTNNNEKTNEKNLPKEQKVKDASPVLHVPSRPDYLADTSIDIRDDMNWIPVSVRRNSFLENMLTDDQTRFSLEKNVPCSVIAAHPKPTSPRVPISSPVQNVMEESKQKSGSSFEDSRRHGDTRQSEIVKSGSNETSQKQLGNETGARIVGPKPTIQSPIASGLGTERRTKSTGEAKSDVLSELLCNFSAIKLKSVESHKRDLERVEMNDKATILGEFANEEARETINATEIIKTEDVLVIDTMGGETKANQIWVESADSQLNHQDKPAMTKTKETPEMMRFDLERLSSLDIDGSDNGKADDSNGRQKNNDKSAVLVIECTENRGIPRCTENGEKIHNLDMIRAKTLDNRDTIVSVDKCAINTKINDPLIRRNNNDNNAMTPVDVSNDQKSCDAEVSTIAPGSVKSFVEMYEIQRDQTSKNSKSNYSEPVAKRLTTRYSNGFGNNAENNETHMKEIDKNVVVKSKFGKMTNDVNKTDEAKIQAHGQIKVGRLCEKERLDSSARDGNCYDSITSNTSVQNGDDGTNRCSRTNDSSYVLHEGNSNGLTPVAAKRRSQESCLKISNEISPRNEAKKTVTFYNDCKTIESCGKPIGDSTNGNGSARPKTPKRRAPGRPAETEILDCATESISKLVRGLNPSGTRTTLPGENPIPSPRSTVSSIRPQPQQPVFEGDKKNGTVKSGIASSVPKSDIPQFRQPCVFYCRV